MVLGRVAPPPWRAEVGGGDYDGAGEAPLRVVHAPELVAGPTAQSVFEESGAQRRRVRSVPLAVQVSVTTSATWCNI